MSYKGHVEDKADVPQCRELRDLVETTQLLREAVALRAKERAASLSDELWRAWQRGNHLQLALSTQGGHGDTLVLLAHALNSAQQARAEASYLISGLGEVRP